MKALLVQTLTRGAGRLIGRPHRVVTQSEQVTILGPVNYEPSMMRVRRANGSVIRVNRDDLTELEVGK